jgi:uncharacterized protein YecE (DUF72 family)
MENSATTAAATDRNKKRPRDASTDDADSQQHQRYGTLWVGTAGWTKTSWKGPFYTPGTKTTGETMLDAYQQKLRTVENNGTCHSMPSKETVLKWKAHCATSFLMAPKMVKYVTHPTNKISNNDHHKTATIMSPESLQALRTFCDTMALLEENLGPILIQFPRTQRITVDHVQAMARVIHASELSAQAKIALELRNHDSIHDPSLLQELRRLRWCLVVHPNSIGRGTMIAPQRDGQQQEYELDPISASWPITAGNWIYVRLHGTNDEHTGRYTPADLQHQAVGPIVSWLKQGIDVYAYILNDDDAAGMPLAALALEQLVYQELQIKIPRAPKQQAKSITSFFAPSKKKK